MNPHTIALPDVATIFARHRRAMWAACTGLMLGLAFAPAGVVAQKAPTDPVAARAASLRLPARLWQDRGDVASLDMIHGAGGTAHAPMLDGTFTFVREDSAGSNGKFDVIDALGVEWKVKLGEETQSETAATRFLWAAGYFVDEDYYVPSLTVQKMPALKRGQNFVSHGVAHHARLERKPAGVTKIGTWDWQNNPFVGQQALNGLKVMMSFLNNWDLKAVNNTIQVTDGERRYVISDLGATFGNTGGVLTRSKSEPKDYEASTFIARTAPDFIDFVQNGKLPEVTRNIPRGDAKWLGARLSKLTDGQIRDGFRAAGYDAADIEILTRTMRLRIAALGAL